MKRMFTAALTAAALAASGGTQAQNDMKGFPNDLQEAIALAKVTGNCGMVRQLFAFQETTKMSGGDEFLLRFLTTEAARLGETPLQFTERCVRATEWYAIFIAEVKKDATNPASGTSSESRKPSRPAGKYILLDDEPAPPGKPARSHR